ncbi:MAG: VWA domain-containing protein [Gemmataceae bacterium]|nr:VWA domain-containing protein [Gemmataceae bacterium]MCI0738538.1 VWA domain-containing protein [Gemmataceae bacterium]
MPEFSQPLWLLLLPLVPLLLWRWRRGWAGLRYSDTRLLQDLPRGKSDRARRWGIALRAIGLTLVVLALAGPRWPDPGTRIPTEGVAIAMVVDVSASMNERDFFWDDQVLSRLDGVKRMFRLFATGGEGPGGVAIPPRPNDLISLVVFATHPETVCPLTLDHAALLKMLDSQDTRSITTEATTNPGDALAWALYSLQKAPTRHKAILFLTDGESNVPPPALTPRQAAQLAGNMGVPIYALDADTEAPEPAKPGDNAKAEQSLKEVARISKGEYFRARDAAALAAACARIDQLQRDRIQSFEFRRYHEGFAWVALAAFVSLTMVVGLEATIWRRIP